MDLKLGGRMLVKYPGLTFVGGLAMAFGIWVGLVTFQVVGLAMHPTLPLPKGDRLVELHTVDVAANDDEGRLQLAAGADGQLTARPLRRTTRMNNKFTSPVLHDGFIYGLDEAILACIDASTGI